MLKYRSKTGIASLLAPALITIGAVTEPVFALSVTDQLEVVRIPSVGAAWQTVTLDNGFASPVVVCAYNLPSSSDNEAVVRVRNAGSGSFDVRIQRPYGGNSGCGAGAYHYGGGGGSMTVSYSTFEANAAAITAHSGPVSVSASIPGNSYTTNGGSIAGLATTSTTIEPYTTVVLHFLAKQYILERNDVRDHSRCF